MGRNPPRIRVRCKEDLKEQFDVRVAKHDGDTQEDTMKDILDFIDQRETEFKRFCDRESRRD